MKNLMYLIEKIVIIIDFEITSYIYYKFKLKLIL